METNNTSLSRSVILSNALGKTEAPIKITGCYEDRASGWLQQSSNLP